MPFLDTPRPRPCRAWADARFDGVTRVLAILLESRAEPAPRRGRAGMGPPRAERSFGARRHTARSRRRPGSSLARAP